MTREYPLDCTLRENCRFFVELGRKLISRSRLQRNGWRKGSIYHLTTYVLNANERAAREAEFA